MLDISTNYTLSCANCLSALLADVDGNTVLDANINNVKGTENIVALCDVDWKYAKGVFDEFPNAKKYWDYRKMYDESYSIIRIVMVVPKHWRQ